MAHGARHLMTASDETLMGLVQSDAEGAEGRAAFDLLVYRFQDQLATFVYRFLGPAGALDDVVQEAFLRVYQSRASFNPASGRFSTWVYTIASNLARSELRRRTARPFSTLAKVGEDGEQPFDPADEHTPAPDARVEAALQDRQIQQALDQLNPVFREVIVLRDVQELAYEEIASVLQVSIGTVKSRVSRGRSQLQALLRGVHESGGGAT